MLGGKKTSSADFNENPLDIVSRYSKALKDKQHSSQLFSTLEQEIKVLLKAIQHELAVKNAVQDLDYTGLGADPEGAMDWEQIARSAKIFETLQKNYGKLFKQKGGTEAIIKEIVSYLALKCQDPECATDPKKRKHEKPPKKITAESQEQAQIRLYKTALRSLLDDAPKSTFGSHLHPGAGTIYGAKQHFSAREMVAYHWLAASDINMPLSKDEAKSVALCIVEEQLHVVNSLAYMRRAHNGKGDKRELQNEIDEPTCPPGVLGQIGNMHVHNKLTGLEEITSPAAHFSKKMQAFIIDKFKERSAEDQFSIIKAKFHLILMDEDDEKNPASDNFFNSLLTSNNLRVFIQKLETEFGPLDEILQRMAAMTLANEVTKGKYKINSHLLERFESIANKSLIDDIQDKTTEELGKLPAVKEQIIELAFVVKQLKLLNDEIILFSNQPTSLSKNLPMLEKTWSSIRTRYNELLEKELAAMDRIQILAREEFTKALQPLETEIRLLKGPEAEILDIEAIASMMFTPFWFKKFKLKFEDAESQCKLDAIGASKLLSSTKEKFLLQNLLNFFANPAYFNPKEMNSELQSLEGVINEYVKVLMAEQDNDSILTFHARKISAKKDKVKSLREDIVSAFGKYLKEKEDRELSPQDRDIVLNILSTDNLSRLQNEDTTKVSILFEEAKARLEQVEFLSTTHTTYDSVLKIIKVDLLKIIQTFEKDIARNIEALGESKEKTVPYKQKMALIKAQEELQTLMNAYHIQLQDPSAAFSAYVLYANQVQAISDALAKALKKIGYPHGLKKSQEKSMDKVQTLFSNLNISVTLEAKKQVDMPLTKEVARANLLFDRFNLKGYEEKAKQAKQGAKSTYESHRQKATPKAPSSFVALESHRTQIALLTEDEIKKAQLYIMAHVTSPEKLELQSYLTPGTLIKITQANKDPAVVSFISPFHGNIPKECTIAISTLKDYAKSQKQLVIDLTHEAEILYNKFSQLLQYDRKYPILFLDQLAYFFENNNLALLNAAFRCQTAQDLNSLITMLKEFPTEHRFNNLKDLVSSSLSKHSVESEPSNRTPSQIERQVTENLRELEDEVAKLYVGYEKPKKNSK